MISLNKYIDNIYNNIYEGFKLGDDNFKTGKDKFKYRPNDIFDLNAYINKSFNEQKDEKIVDLNDIDVSNITNLSNLFVGRSIRTNRTYIDIDVSKWDVSKVKKMDCTFNNPKIRKVIGLENWNVGNVESMISLFQYSCIEDFSGIKNWDVSKVGAFSYTFALNKDLKTLDLSNWNVANVKNMYEMFFWCDNLSEIKGLENWNVSSCLIFNGMFKLCKNLKSLDLSKWDMKSATNIGEMFSDCSMLTSVGDLSNWETKDLGSIERLFAGCKKLDNADFLSKWKIKKSCKRDSVVIGTNLKNPHFKRI